MSIVLRDRHRRLCLGCTKAPIGTLVQPALAPGLALTSDLMRRAVCMCDTAEGVWLCQPCGRSIRGADYDYQAYADLPYLQPPTPFFFLTGTMTAMWRADNG